MKSQADKTSFAGSYSLTGSKGALKQPKAGTLTLQVVQTESKIEVERAVNGVRIAYNCPLTGGESTYTTPDGGSGTCKAKWKGKELELERLIRHPQPNGPAAETQVWERWKLTPDLKTLTIRSDVNFPGTPINGALLIGPTTEIYTRN